MSFVYCRAKLTRCMGVAAFDVDQLVNGKVDGWECVSRRVGVYTPDYDGVCPACIEAAKPTSEKRRISGGTKFDPVELEAGGKVVPPDRQGTLF